MTQEEEQYYTFSIGMQSIEESLGNEELNYKFSEELDPKPRTFEERRDEIKARFFKPSSKKHEKK
eukprot:CAMPEP_0116909342 /NCGR_PEP_ID=MMETSP0467-20121206/14221_1 /TAXON_ID=283647 /ORGANISM="Mesodinium pulex, Strain SPMC105" /LENGTH=64 /DNA_ID=CAMNT_0004584687 /DNA_START=1858 /DNA_END=2052 /DNA_ORIENTATION=+